MAKDRTPAQKITEKGYPQLRKPSVPGYNKPSGTPGWVSKPANSAAKKAK